VHGHHALVCGGSGNSLRRYACQVGGRNLQRVEHLYQHHDRRHRHGAEVVHLSTEYSYGVRNLRPDRLGGGAQALHPWRLWGEDLAVFMDVPDAGHRIGVVPDVTTSYVLRSLAVNIPAGRHTFYFAPYSNLSSTQRILLDYVEFHDTGDTTTSAQCGDGVDNDRDGSIDYPNDPGCSSLTDNDETNSTTPPPPPSGARPGVGTGTAAECDVVVPAGTSNTALTNALNNVPDNLGGNHYVICMRGGSHGDYISIKPRITGDTASARLILKSYPGEQASLHGEVQPSSSYNFFTLRDFQIDGRFKRCANGSIPNPDCGGDTTNQGNPNMRPSLRVSGNAMEIINMDLAGGNDLPNGGGNNLNTRSTCVAYSGNPTNSLIEHSWIHNCGIPAAVSAGDADAHCIYTTNAGNGGIIRDNLIWDCAESGIHGYGSSVGAKNMLFEDNILWRGGPNMSIGGASSGNTVRDSLFLDPTNGKNLKGNAPSTVTNNCLDSPIDNSAVTTSGNVIVSPSQASVSGDPRNRNLTITAPSTCLAKYGGTWPIGT
jgi:hypothetical protein